MGVLQFNETQPVVSITQFAPADTTVAKQVQGNQNVFARLDTLLVTNSDTIAHVVDVLVRLNATNYQLGSVSVPAGQGFSGTPAVDILVALLPTTQVGMFVTNGYQIYASMEVTINAGKVVTFFAIGGTL